MITYDNGNESLYSLAFAPPSGFNTPSESSSYFTGVEQGTGVGRALKEIR